MNSGQSQIIHCILTGIQIYDVSHAVLLPPPPPSSSLLPASKFRIVVMIHLCLYGEPGLLNLARMPAQCLGRGGGVRAREAAARVLVVPALDGWSTRTGSSAPAAE